MSEVSENPFDQTKPEVSLIAVEADRAMSEVKAALVIARTNPRNKQEAMERILTQCARPTFASIATYQYARGGADISGASIKLAETMAREWGNLEAGVVELSRENGVSDCLAYAWDLQTNYREKKSFRVRHWRDTKRGGYAITDERDLYELIANMGARRKRACILSVIGDEVEQAALKATEKTLLEQATVTPERISQILARFAEFKVTKEQIEKKIQRNMDAITPKQVVELGRIYNSLRDGMSAPRDWFETPPLPVAESPDLNERLQARSGLSERPAATKAGTAKGTEQKPEAGQN